MRTVIILSGVPCSTDIFINREILELERRGLVLDIVVFEYSKNEKVQPTLNRIKAPVHYLPKNLLTELPRVWRAWRMVRHWPGYREARARWLNDLQKDMTTSRVRVFCQALVMASELGPEVSNLHAYFLDAPASVARYTALLKGLPWSCTAHSLDTWTTPGWEIKEKLSDLQWLVTCTQANENYLKNVVQAPSKVSHAYHGLDTTRYLNTESSVKPGSPVRLLSMGRAGENGGYEDLLTALAALPAELAWTFTHIGGGPRLKSLKRTAKSDGLERRITWLGPQTHEEVIHAYQNTDVFVLPSNISKIDDWDALFYTLMEAQYHSLACIATCVSAIPELILHEETGLLAVPGDPDDLANQITRYLGDFELRKRLAEAGRARVVSKFLFNNCIREVVNKFGLDDAVA